MKKYILAIFLTLTLGYSPAHPMQQGQKRPNDGALIEEAETKRQKNESAKIKPFMCEGCGNKFATKQNLQKHQAGRCKGFQSPKNHACSFPDCRASFDRSTDLNRHRLIHLAVKKPFICECGTKFTREDNLNAHKQQRCPLSTQKKAAEACEQQHFDFANPLGMPEDQYTLDSLAALSNYAVDPALAVGAMRLQAAQPAQPMIDYGARMARPEPEDVFDVNSFLN